MDEHVHVLSLTLLVAPAVRKHEQLNHALRRSLSLLHAQVLHHPDMVAVNGSVRSVVLNPGRTLERLSWPRSHIVQ
jgi:hypothetical protein